MIQVKIDRSKLEKLLRELPDEAVRILHDGTNYGVFQEFGFTHWKSGEAIPAQPFITPACEAVRDELVRGFRQIIEHQTMGADEFVETVARHAQSLARQFAPVDTGNLRNTIDVHRPSEVAEMLR
jgi:hypothetical protein